MNVVYFVYKLSRNINRYYNYATQPEMHTYHSYLTSFQMLNS